MKGEKNKTNKEIYLPVALRSDIVKRLPVRQKEKSGWDRKSHLP